MTQLTILHTALISNPNKAHLWGENVIGTPLELVEDILSRLPIYWNDPSLKFLDPACGRGTFLVAVFDRLRQAGHSHQHIVENMLFGVDIDEKNVAFTRGCLRAGSKYRTNIECCDALTKDWNMKFDVVVGNPPYQHPTLKNGNKLWVEFVKKAHTLGVEGGTVALVTPDTWTTMEDVYNEYFLPYECCTINLEECGKHFPGIGIDFSYFVVKKVQNTGKDVAIRTPMGDFLSPLPAKYLTVDVACGGIFTKILNHTNPLGVFKSYTHHSDRVAKGLMTLSPSAGSIPVLSSFSAGTDKYYYDSKPCPKQQGCWRVIVPGWHGQFAKSFVSATIETTESFFQFPVESEAEATVLLSVLGSSVYRFVCLKISPKKSLVLKAVQQLPAVDLTRSWTDAELYAHFNLTQEEIDLIESTVK